MIRDDLRHIDYFSLDISDYSRNYILRLLPNLDYYLQIYDRCISILLSTLRRQPSQLTVVDYGGGHGFLSCLLKERGFARVIYIDFNPQAASAVTAVRQCLGYGPDVILQGDAATLLHWCQQNAIRPDGLLGMDVIEHIYRLDTFFADLYAIAPMPMLFTTGSTPYNPHVVRRLHRVMRSDEHGRNGQPGFCQLRRQYLAEHLPQLSAQELDYWAEHTRGFRYDDLIKAVVSKTPAPAVDPYNTCDPTTGSWTERILPIKAYRQLLTPYGARLSVTGGFYNTHRSPFKALPSRLLNLMLRIGGKGCLFLAPFIILQIDTPAAS